MSPGAAGSQHHSMARMLTCCSLQVSQVWSVRVIFDLLCLVVAKDCPGHADVRPAVFAEHGGFRL